jgi:hypothetical protein
MWSVCVLLAFAGTARLSLNAQQPNPDNTSYSSSAEDYARSHNVESLTFSAIPQNADPLAIIVRKAFGVAGVQKNSQC